MIRVGGTYRAADGSVFGILAHKAISSSNGHNYIGENKKTGAITYFNHKGENSFRDTWNLECDPYTWCPIYNNGMLMTTKFLRKKDLDIDAVDSLMGFYRIENNDPTTVTFCNLQSFENFYAA